MKDVRTRIVERWVVIALDASCFALCAWLILEILEVINVR